MDSIRYGLTVITPPAYEPVTLEEMRRHLKDPPSDEDNEIAAWMQAAREWVESYTGRTLVDTTLEVSFEAYPDWQIFLPRPPIIQVVSFKYISSDGVDTTLAADQYVLDQSLALSPRVVPAYGVAWPGTRWQPSSLRIRYRAGYARDGVTPDERSLVPSSLRSAIKLIVGHLFEHRENVVEGQALRDLPMGAQWLCGPYRVDPGV